MDELLTEFLTECSENMTLLDMEVVTLEQNPNNPDLIGSIFRIVHTIKGTCGFLGLPRLERVAHAAENVLGKFRDGEMEVNAAAVTIILKSLDRIKHILDELEANQAEPDGDDADLIAELDRIVAGEMPDAAATPAATPVAANGDDEDEHGFVPVSAAAMAQSVAAEAAQEAAAEASVAEPVAQEPVAAAAPAKPAAAAPAQKTAASPAKPAAASEPAAGGNRGESLAAQTLRVPVDLLETLMTLVSELVLTRNQLLQMVRNTSDSSFKAPLQRLSHITSELQEGVMKTRMQPIGNAWSKLPRIIRDLSVDLGKQIELKMIGAETELDRQVLDLIKDPLTHMVRNSADHGLEMPADRRAAGKPEKGVVTLHAYHEGGHIIIQISDDGKGLDVTKISAKALSSGITNETEIAGLTEQQIMQFIFKPGFSTAEAVTNVSGRGVGMDVVRTNIEKIGGSIELRSALGKGSTFTIKIPLTLAIVSALIVESGSERFAIPQIGVVELVRAGATSEHRIEVIDGSTILRLRDRLLPLMSLSRLLGLVKEDKTQKVDEAYVVVSQVGTRLFGLIVDQVFDTEEIVVKPVAPILRDIGVFSGNTILGDGSVVMILDLNGITGSLSTTSAANSGQPATQGHQFDSDSTSLLLFRTPDGGPKAVPLALVTRLEEVTADQIEWSGSQSVMQYRDHLMPLTDLHGQPVSFDQGAKPVLVFTDIGHNMGLVVDEIIDIAECNIAIESKGTDNGVLGTAIIAGKSTDLIDVAYFVNRVFGGWFEAEEQEPFDSETGQSSATRVLIVDDSAFFRNMLKPLLEANGYVVTTAINPPAALELRDDGRMFDIIISDIEMPEMDGFGFAQACRAGGAWQQMPIIALTSHTTPKDVERGRNVGFTDYVGKLDREALLATLAQCSKTKAGAA